ncbi:hypothetical protein A2716_04860 [candidate division WWE3 bacterium RIFCSPHIGHO2_01_FULL_40_23]|uniref:N(4)-bis(aminopropyl)spermidine synthase C-terminal domain-containing protein n=1 Tax=candidate division WWE3 bacterium RIFCSPLOWO2_01_FULL_41_18 TaxID=1802625 RepID=A0A1F4VE36_UNCKA|nr:MAG: hypothetical protein A2716_04860 [candidate division WWE3 bacterium RIFCSPHIGHO2_01_FULL_40_23]OGC55200.1 MAG: hypothetical protein A3A78_04470 [candidate division WWE3 bacterium RIFCSPLOWO2_01_FULL_41_18]
MDLKNLSEKVGISSGDLFLILENIKREGRISTHDLIGKTGFSKETLKKFRDNFSSYLEPVSNFFILNDNGKKFLSSLTFNKKAFEASDELLIHSLYKECATSRPKPKREYDQFYSTEDTQVKRIKFLMENEAYEDASILFLGDDDLTSLCLLEIGAFKNVAVCDIDPSQLSFIESVAKKKSFDIQLYYADLREGLPKDLIESYDVVFSDPPYTPSGFKLFLSRELEALWGSFGKAYICFGSSERSLERFLLVQSIINEFNLAIIYALFNFNRYESALSIGSSSNLYTLMKTPKTKVSKKLDVSKIYTYE